MSLIWGDGGEVWILGYGLCVPQDVKDGNLDLDLVMNRFIGIAQNAVLI